MQQERFLAAFQAYEKNGAAPDPQWTHALRKAAISRFVDLGFPTARRGNEEWKYTDIGLIANAPHQPITSPSPTSLQAKELAAFTFGESNWRKLVFVDGSYVERLSSVFAMSPGVTVGSLAEAMTGEDHLVEQHLAQYANYEDNAFTALNTAFVHDGAFVHIADGIVVEEPIHLLFLSTSPIQDAISLPRVLVMAGKESKATIIESYGTLAESRYFTNAVTEVVVGDGASLSYYRVQQESDQAFHVHTTQVSLARDSNFSSVTLDLGSRLARNNLNVLMGQEGSACMLNGLYIVTGSQHVDNQVIVDHAKPHTTTRELYKGILDGKSRAVFHGSIVVRQGAQKVDARQEDKNLLLSDQAEADTKPAFWIYADDVKCSHGASCGALDEHALFYLRSRGLSEREARTMLTRGFVSEVINTIHSEPIRTHLDELVMARLESL